MPVSFETRSGRAIFEGDIDLGPAENIPRSREELLRVVREDVLGLRLGVVISDLGRRWPSGYVPYVIHEGFPNPQRIYDALANYQANVAGISFGARQGSDNNYIFFAGTTDPEICGSSEIGRIGGAQMVWINDSCDAGTVIHEVGHALGFWHEQSRCDRDSFVEILWNNIQEGWENQFDRFCSGASDLESYDEGSIMHYSTHAFGRVVDGSRLQTIRSLRGRDSDMGQHNGLSTIDSYTINRMYKPYGPSGVSISYPGGTPTVSWNASSGASNYDVSLVIEYAEYNDYENTSNIYDYSTDAVGSTAGLSLQDGQHSNTGTSRCVIWSDINGNASYLYYYEVVAYFPNGLFSSARRLPANVAPSSC